MGICRMASIRCRGASLGTLIGAIKNRRKREPNVGVIEVSYIGEEGRLDVDSSKIKCEKCRRGLERLS